MEEGFKFHLLVSRHPHSKKKYRQISLCYLNQQIPKLIKNFKLFCRLILIHLL